MHLSMCLSVLLVVACQHVSAEVFTAVADMEGLISTEAELVRNLENYIQAEEQRLQLVKNLKAEYEKMYEEASSDVPKYISNPINAYLLVKRLTSDWRHVEGIMTQNTGPAFIQNITQHRSILRFPTDEDLNGAAVALMRLQDTYLLDTHALAEGQLLGKKYSQQLTANDCFELGRQSYNNGDHYHTVLWMAEALRKTDQENDTSISRQEILEYLAFSTFKQGNVKEALQLTLELLKIVPYHQRALGNKKYYEDLIRQQNVKRRGETGEDSSPVDVGPMETFSPASLKLTKPTDHLPEREKYEALCRGEQFMHPKKAAALRCKYVTNNVPYLFLQPVKMEEANLHPYIVIYHQVINDDEIETIKRMAQPRFKRATVQNHKTGNLEPASYRISKSAWLKSEEHDHVFKVSRRVGDITGLDMDTAEDLQVVNYGIGGHYEPHFDYARKTDADAFESLGTGNRIATWLFYKEEVNAFKDLGWGNRIATWLFYMSDVEAGGATVFPHLDLALWPQKGSAAFWYNLLPSGEGDTRTRHAACPVLTGFKWVSNKWIHEKNQEFRRPCKLDFDDE